MKRMTTQPLDCFQRALKLGSREFVIHKLEPPTSQRKYSVTCRCKQHAWYTSSRHVIYAGETSNTLLQTAKSNIKCGTLHFTKRNEPTKSIF